MRSLLFAYCMGTLVLSTVCSAQVLSVTGVAPDASTGGSNPAISLKNSAGTNVTSALGTGTKYFTASGAAVPSGNLVCGDPQGGITDCGTFNSLSPSSPVMRAAGGNDVSVIYQGGQDMSTTPSSGELLGSVTVTGASVTGLVTSAMGAKGGSVVVQGGDENATSGPGAGGDATLRPGAVTATSGDTANTIPGRLHVAQTYRVGSSFSIPHGTSLGGNLGCVTGHNTVSDCPSAALNPTYVGVNYQLLGTYGAVEQLAGIVNVNSDPSSPTRFTNGDVVCTSTTVAGVVVDNGTSPCVCPSVQVGIVDLSDGIASTFHAITMARGGCVAGTPNSATAQNNFGTQQQIENLRQENASLQERLSRLERLLRQQVEVVAQK